MDYRDRAQIDRCRNEISPKINMCDLWPQLLRNKVFNHDDVNVPRWTPKLDQQETVHDILDTIKTRGPRAFKNLVLSLRETSHSYVADILEGKAPLTSDGYVPNDNRESLNNESVNHNSDDDWYCSKDFITTEKPLEINVKLATKFMENYDGMMNYRMKTRPHGYVLIITIIAYEGEIRKAAEFDQDNLKKLFEGMGFDVTLPDPKTVFTGAEVHRIIKDFSKRDFNRTDSCFVIISAHGKDIEHNGAWETEIHGVDYESPKAMKVLCSDIVDMFTAECCQQLAKKPKVFIFQTCRGKLEQRPINRTAADGVGGSVRNYSDIFIAHSTLPGHKAYRDEYNGSWYIQILCEVFMRNAWNTDLCRLFKQIDDKLKNIRTLDGRAQSSTVKTMGVSKDLYLNPGIFEES